MVLKNTESTIAYRCPHCGSGILAMVGVFALSGDMIKLKCDCGHSELLIQKCGDGKIRLTVPCMFCPKPHQYVLSHAAFFDQSIYTIPCGMTGVDICFIGHKDDVLSALADNEKQLLDMLKEAGYGDDASIADLLRDESDDDDETYYDDVNFTDNHIYRSTCSEKWHPGKHLFNLTHSRNVDIKNNTWVGLFSIDMLTEDTCENVHFE
jgi:hypothetical protein